jgi:hypothetical protein
LDDDDDDEDDADAAVRTLLFLKIENMDLCFLDRKSVAQPSSVTKDLKELVGEGGTGTGVCS